MKQYTYFQLLDTYYNELVKGDDNPASISDNMHGQTASKLAREWMRENNIKEAILVTNVLTNDGCDNILSQRELTVKQTSRQTIMKTIELRESDMDRVQNMNAKNGYVLNIAQMKRLINEHQKGNDYKRALIEYRLTGINFHREVGLLKDGKYEDLKAQVGKW